MVEIISEMLSFDFMVRAFCVGIMVSLCSALLGVSLVLKRYSMIGDGLSHVGFSALAFAMVLNVAPMTVAIPVVVIAAFLLLRLTEQSKVRGDAAIALIATGSLAVGVFAISITKGMNVDINSYMFGSILTMTDTDVWLSIVLSVIVIALYLFSYHKIFAITFDETFSRATGLNVEAYNALLAVLCAVTVVLGMRMMGTLLISSLIIFPALSAMQVCKTFRQVVLLSALLATLCFVVGLYVSYVLATPTGASVVLTNMCAFFLCYFIGHVRSRD